MSGKFKIFRGLYRDMYSFYGSDDEIINLLAMFLTDDVGGDTSYYKNWALNPSPMGSGGNISDFRKREWQGHFAI